MARPLRIEYADALYHVTSLGDRREAIYRDDEDRLIWLDVFSQVNQVISDALAKSRHTGENRCPALSQLPENTGFRLSPE